MKPITPKEVKEKEIPEKVIEAFNSLIKKGWDGSESRVMQNDIVSLITEYYLRDEMALTASGTKHYRSALREKMFADHYLDVEGLYKKAGWVVIYDKPGYNENYEASWTFKKSSRRSN